MTQAASLDGLSLSAKHLANLAGEQMCALYPWKWLRNRSAKLDARGTIAIASFTWTESSLTLSRTSSFADYTFVEGDEVEITGGTGATAGFYRIASRTNDDAIVLISSIGSAADGNADIAGTMPLPTCSLPTDFGDLDSISATDTLANGINMTTRERILSLRTNQIDATSGWLFYGAIVYVNSTINPVPTPVLEIYPNPASNSTAQFTIFYRARWTELTDDTQIVRIPTWMEPLYVQMCRAYALGYEDEDVAGLDVRLAQLASGPVWKAAVNADFRVQPTGGPMRGGAVRPQIHGHPNAISTEVAGPT